MYEISYAPHECLPRLHFEKARCQCTSIPITILINMIEANDANIVDTAPITSVTFNTINKKMEQKHNRVHIVLILKNRVNKLTRSMDSRSSGVMVTACGTVPSCPSTFLIAC